MACGLALEGNSSSTATPENESIGERDVSNMVTQNSIHSDEAAPRTPAGEALATAQVENKVFASYSSKDKVASSGSSIEAKEGMVPHAEISPKLAATKPTRRVTFDPRLTTAVWPALSDYDRTSIVVDLSKTPFALFRKDAVLMAKSAAATTTPAEHCVPSSPAPLATRIPTKETSVPTAAGANDDGIESSPQPDAAGSRLRAVSLDYESDSSSAVTDTETMSETDSIPCLDWEGVGMEEEGPAFYGVWKRTSSEGYEALLLSSGVPKRAIAMALRKHPVHIIDHDGSYFRLIVKNGLSKADNTFFIGDEPRMDKIGKQSYEVSINWAHLTGNGTRHELSLSSVCAEKGEEVLAIRSLEDGGNRMVLTQIVRRPAENYEVKAKHFFKRVTDKSELRSDNGGRALMSNVVIARQPKTEKTGKHD